MEIIDFRVRPLYKGYCAMAERKTTDKFLQGLGLKASPSITERSLAMLVREMDEAGVDLAVVPGRQSAGTSISNEELFEIADLYPDRFLIFPLYDPLKAEDSLKEIRRLVVHGAGRGVTIEPGFGNTLRFDDPAYEPLYQLMEAYQLPVMATFSGSITTVFDQSLPERFHRVAKAHPNLPLIAGHGGWPWIRELTCMAFFTDNIYLAPDLYALHCPGSWDYREAANYMLQERCLFGSSYPLVPIHEAVNAAKGWKLRPDAQALYFYKNAERLLKL